jgi:hypothetical protein
VLAVAQAVGQQRILLLQAAGFGQQQPAQLGGVGRRMDLAAEAQFDQPGQVAAVRQVGARQQHRVDRTAGHRQRRAVAQAQLLQAEEQAAVQQQPAAVALDEQLRSGRRPGPSQKAQLHAKCSCRTRPHSGAARAGHSWSGAAAPF